MTSHAINDNAKAETMTLNAVNRFMLVPPAVPFLSVVVMEEEEDGDVVLHMVAVWCSFGGRILRVLCLVRERQREGSFCVSRDFCEACESILPWI